MTQFRKFWKPIFDDDDDSFKVKQVWHRQLPCYKEHCIVEVEDKPHTYWEECTFWDVIKGKLANLFGGE